MEAKLSYKGLGKADGKQVSDAFVQVGGLMKEIVIRRAKELHNNKESVDDYLDGYGEMTNKSRKSEFRRIMTAFYLDPERVEILAETVDYHALYAACVEIAPSGMATRTKTKKVSDNVHAAIVEKVAIMNEKQAATVLQVAANHVATLGGDWERKIVNQMTGLTLILQKSTDKGYLTCANSVFAVLDKLAKRLEIADAKAAAAKTKVEVKDNTLPAAPAPIGNVQVPAPVAKVA